MSRADRVAALIRSEISTILQKEVSDPRIGFVSITEVELGPDLQLAKVHVSIMGDEKQRNESMKGLQSATNHIRYKLGPSLDLKTMPEIVFKLDTSFERGNKVFEVLKKIEKEKE